MCDVLDAVLWQLDNACLAFLPLLLKRGSKNSDVFTSSCPQTTSSRSSDPTSRVTRSLRVYFAEGSAEDDVDVGMFESYNGDGLSNVFCCVCTGSLSSDAVLRLLDGCSVMVVVLRMIVCGR